MAGPEFALNSVNAVSANRSRKHTMFELSKLPITRGDGLLHALGAYSPIKHEAYAGCRASWNHEGLSPVLSLDMASYKVNSGAKHIDRFYPLMEYAPLCILF